MIYKLYYHPYSFAYVFHFVGPLIQSCIILFVFTDYLDTFFLRYLLYFKDVMGS